MPKVKAIQTQYGDYGHKIIGDEWVVSDREAKSLLENKLIEIVEKKPEPKEIKEKSSDSLNTGKKK